MKEFHIPIQEHKYTRLNNQKQCNPTYPGERIKEIRYKTQTTTYNHWQPGKPTSNEWNSHTNTGNERSPHSQISKSIKKTQNFTAKQSKIIEPA